MRGATGWPSSGPSPAGYFNPRAPYGARRTGVLSNVEDFLFQSSRPLRGATISVPSIRLADRAAFQSSRPLRGATQSRILWCLAQLGFQSSRPLRGATHCLVPLCVLRLISILAPLTGRDAQLVNGTNMAMAFQSSRPLRGATVYGDIVASDGDFNPRAPCGARLTGGTVAAAISNFNPRAPCGARHVPQRRPAKRGAISILAPLAGRDRMAGMTQTELAAFQSSRPLRGATSLFYLIPAVSVFQSSRPLRGATGLFLRNGNLPGYFNPRAPCGARHPVVTVIALVAVISILAPLAGRDKDVAGYW